MRKLLSILFLSLCVATCSKDDAPQPEMNETVKQIWQTLNGTYIGFHEDKLSSAASYTETIAFQPYSEPENRSSFFQLTKTPFRQHIIGI